MLVVDPVSRRDVDLDECSSIVEYFACAAFCEVCPVVVRNA